MSSDNQEPVTVEQCADSGFTPERLEQAELLWANLPTGRPWPSLQTYEKALVIHQLTRPQPTASEDEIRKAKRMAAGGCYCKDTCGAPVIMGRQTKCLRNPPLQPGQPIAAKAQEAGSDDVERVARAIWMTGQSLAQLEEIGDTFDGLPEYAQDHNRDLARAAIRALRDDPKGGSDGLQ